MTDRITPYKDGGSIQDRIDEIVATAPPAGVHFEMMDNGRAWIRIGREIFWIEAKGRKLVCWHSETWDNLGLSEPAASPEGRETT
jgi:hypothetical protein